MSQKWVTVKQACNILGISRTTLYRRIKQGEIETKKDESSMTSCFIDVPNGTDNGTINIPDGTPRSAAQLEQEMKQWREKVEFQVKEIAELKQELRRKDERLEDNRQRQDTIILQLTRQLDQSQRLLEYHREPWYRRWFKKKQTPGDGTRQ
jgi:hypothetical protein